LSGGIGYSEAYKFMLNGNFTEANFLGTGQRVAVNLSTGAYSKVYSLSQTDPYVTTGRIESYPQLLLHRPEPAHLVLLDLLQYELPGGARLQLSDHGVASPEIRLLGKHSEYIAPSYTSQQIQDWVRLNGNSFFRSAGTTAFGHARGHGRAHCRVELR